MRFVLIGQPNSGKSTLFNQVAGYRAETGNFTGTTVTFTESKVRVSGEIVALVDLPGTYTLSGSNPAETETIRYLLTHEVDVILNIVDATRLVQGLSLTLELLELGIPVVVAMNMMDEASRLGIKIDGPKLHEMLGVSVVPMVASKGRGVRNLFLTAFQTGKINKRPKRFRYSTDIECIIDDIIRMTKGLKASLRNEAIIIKLLESDRNIGEMTGQIGPDFLASIDKARKEILNNRGQEPVWVFSGERHLLAQNLSGQVMDQGEYRLGWREHLDDFLLHPFWGYIALVIILLIFFETIYGVGSLFEGSLIAGFTKLEVALVNFAGTDTLIGGILSGVVQGISGGAAIVLPYLFPFLLGLGFLEDVGYLPRVAFLMDALMNRIGLHGKAIVPFILGYGCNVPAVMSTRMLEDRRDRFLASALATLVPCAARLAVVFGLVAYYLGPRIALGIYLFNLFVIALTGRIISAMLPEETPGMILEVPFYRLPTLKSILNKSWFRAREFVVEAWPILIVGSILLAVLNFYEFDNWFNIIIKPITWILGLPEKTGVPLIFGILRKELSLIMLRQALGVNDFSAALSSVQMITFTVFVVFYVPCLATIAVLKRELGTRDMLVITCITVIIAVVAALFARGLATIIF